MIIVNDFAEVYVKEAAPGVPEVLETVD